jgi:hypothetical protein
MELSVAEHGLSDFLLAVVLLEAELVSPNGRRDEEQR